MSRASVRVLPESQYEKNYAKYSKLLLFRALLYRCRGGFERIQVFVLLREAHCAIEEVSKFVQDCAGFGNVDLLLCVYRRTNAVYAEFAAEIREILCADHECPAVFVESVNDRLWDFAEFQQECVHIPLCK